MPTPRKLHYDRKHPGPSVPEWWKPKFTRCAWCGQAAPTHTPDSPNCKHYQEKRRS